MVTGGGIVARERLFEPNRLSNAPSLSELLPDAPSLAPSRVAERERVKWILGNECLLPEPRSSRSILKGSPEPPSLEVDCEWGTEVMPSAVSESRSESDVTAVEGGSAVSTHVV